MKFRIPLFIFAFILASGLLACSSGDEKPDTPIETFKTYTKAIKQKDITTMKLLLSDATMKMNETEAQARGIPVDDVVKNETLFNENQKTVKWRNEKITGETATLEVENAFGSWETVPFVKEGGVWKIDKKGYADRMLQDIEQNNQQIQEP